MRVGSNIRSDSEIDAGDLKLEIHRGAGAVLLVAPHGGRRPAVDAAAPPPKLRVNDVYTPEITRILAQRLDASFIINSTHDRNRLDLNRLSQVRRHAPRFLALLAQEIGAILDRHARAEVVFVHGWNVGQPKCDIGIGGVERGDTVVPLNGTTLSVSPEYLHTRLAALRLACAQMGIAAPTGERYPGSHRNNLLQLFRGGDGDSDDAQTQRIGAWVREGRVNALQLELGIPLRWPGEWRGRFVTALVSVFDERPAGAVEDRQPRLPRVTRSPQDSSPGTPPLALQLYDASSGIGMLAGVGPMSARSTGGRLLLFLGGQRVALFTGEDAGRSRALVAPLECVRDGECTRLRFSGPMLELPDAAAYIDLEAALAASRLVEADVDVRFEPRHEPQAGAPVFGAIAGDIAVGSRRATLRCAAFANAGGLRAGGLGSNTTITAAFGPDRAVVSRATEREPVLALHFSAGAVRAEAGAEMHVALDGDAYTPASVELRCSSAEPLRAQPLSRMAILRPAGAGYLRVTFGTARFRWGDLEGAGLYEHARPLTVPSRQE